MRCSTLLGIGLVLFGFGCANQESGKETAMQPDVAPRWAVSMDAIDACSCPLLCQCNSGGGRSMQSCQFNSAFKIRRGNFGNTSLDNVTFWMAGDLGADISRGRMDWAILRFEPAATSEQRRDVIQIMHHIFPFRWNSFTTGDDAKIDWKIGDDGAVAKLNEGKSAEIVLTQVRDAAGKPTVIQNAQFWAVPHNSGLLVMQTNVEAYRDGDKPFEVKGTNGFFTTLEMSSADLKEAHTGTDVQFLSTTTEKHESGCCGK